MSAPGMSAADAARFPTAAGLLFGIGLGGFFDGIVLHQVLQWHNMVTSAGYPPDSVANLEFNTLLDGLFHVATYVFVAAVLVAASLLFINSALADDRADAELAYASCLLVGLENQIRGGQQR